MWRSEKSLVLKIQERNAKGKIRIDEKDKPLAIPEWHSFRGLVVPGGKRKTNADKSGLVALIRSEEHTSELQSLMRISYAVFCLKKKSFQMNDHCCILAETDRYKQKRQNTKLYKTHYSPTTETNY